MQKIRYEVDPHNRLVVSGTGARLPLTRFRRVVDGQFKTGPSNSLIYHIKAPMQGIHPDLKAPHQVKLRGKWALTKNHDLRLTLDKWRRQIPGDKLTLQGEIISAKADSLLFAVTTRSEKNLPSVYTLKLQGIWQADKNNRLIFRANKGQGIYDTLILNAVWEIDKQHRIVYRYEKTLLKRKEKLEKTLTFKGSWDIIKGNRLSYELGLDGKSAFTFSGKWKIKKNLGLLFEVESAKNKVKAITFGADARLGKKDKVEFRLKNRFGKNLGATLKLSRKLLKGDGEAFLKLLKDEQEASLSAGAAWRW